MKLLTLLWLYYSIWTVLFLTNVPIYFFISSCQVLMARKSFWLLFQTSAAPKQHAWSIYVLLHVSRSASRLSPLTTMRIVRWTSATEGPYYPHTAQHADTSLTLWMHIQANLSRPQKNHGNSRPRITTHRLSSIILVNELLLELTYNVTSNASFKVWCVFHRTVIDKKHWYPSIPLLTQYSQSC